MRQSVCSSRAARYSATKSAPFSIVGTIWWGAAYMVTTKCSPDDLPVSDDSVHLSPGSLRASPLRHSSASSSAIASCLFAPSFLMVCNALANYIITPRLEPLTEFDLRSCCANDSSACSTKGGLVWPTGFGLVRNRPRRVSTLVPRATLPAAPITILCYAAVYVCVRQRR